jgi:uncharacterized protein (DUF1697 family)
MNTWISICRGIKEGGTERMLMFALKELLNEPRLNLIIKNPKIHGRRGNIVFRAEGSKESVRKVLSEAISERFNINPVDLLFTQEEFHQQVLDANPYYNPNNENENWPMDLREIQAFFYLRPLENPDTKALKSFLGKYERFTITPSVLFLHAPLGIGDSKFAKNVQECLKIPITNRDFRTCQKIYDLAIECTKECNMPEEEENNDNKAKTKNAKRNMNGF